jgi:predicted oxidoreductase (fatty acid repression mutant protein)
MKGRRSFYMIGDKMNVSDKEVQDIVGNAVTLVPSPFNCQSQRVVLLLGKEHKELWDIVMRTLKKIVPADKFAPTEAKVNSFKAGYGSVLYFDDTATTHSLMEQFPSFKDNFPVWAQQANGMLQYAVWMGLENAGLGVSLQHYNPLIDAEVKKRWNLPESWMLIAEMPFGTPTAQPQPKTSMPVTERMKVFGK